MALQFTISDVVATEINLQSAHKVLHHNIKNTGSSDVFILVNPTCDQTTTTFTGNSDALFGSADAYISDSQRLLLDANVHTILAVCGSDFTTTIDIGVGAIY